MNVVQGTRDRMSIARAKTMQMGAGGAAFSPSQISGLFFGFDANSSVWEDTSLTVPAIDDGDLIRGITNYAGSNHATQSTASKRLSLQLAERNGNKALQGDGTDDHVVTASISHGIGTGDFYIVFIANSPASAAYQGLGAIGAFTPGFYFHNGKPHIWNGTADRAFATSLSTSTWYMIEFMRTSGTLKCWVNGTLDSNSFSDSFSIANGAVFIGAGQSGAEGFNGLIEAAWFYSTAPTAGQQASMRTYYGF